jgi:ubiquinone/menaquinone biosynthesis C-methylase UbiE
LRHELKRVSHAEFSAWASTYDSHWLNHFLFEPSHELLLRELGPVSPGRVLDIGCGTGELACRLAARGWEVVGLDLCEPMLHRAHAKSNGWMKQVHLSAGDSEHLPFASATFDAVTCANSFHHYPHQQAVVREMFRVLKPGGRLLLLDGWPDHWVGRIVYDWIITRVEGGYVWHRESHHMWAMVQDAGFQDVTQRRVHSLFPILLTRGVVPAAPTPPPCKEH